MKLKMKAILHATIWILTLLNPSKPFKINYVTSYHEFNILSHYIFGHPIEVNVTTCEYSCYEPITNSFANERCLNDTLGTNYYMFCFAKHHTLQQHTSCSERTYVSCVVQVTIKNTYVAYQLNEGIKLHRYEITECEKTDECGLVDYESDIEKFFVGGRIFKRIEEAKNNSQKFVDISSGSIYVQNIPNPDQVWLGINLNSYSEKSFSKIGWFRLGNHTTDSIYQLMNKIQFGQATQDWTLDAAGIRNCNTGLTKTAGEIENEQHKFSTSKLNIFLQYDILELFYHIPLSIIECEGVDFVKDRAIHYTTKEGKLACVAVKLSSVVYAVRNGSQYLKLKIGNRVISENIPINSTVEIGGFKVTFSRDKTVCVEDMEYRITSSSNSKICGKYSFDIVPMTVMNLASTASLTIEITVIAVVFLVLILLVTFLCWRKNQQISSLPTSENNIPLLAWPRRKKMTI